jgi:hypothetical protein
MCREGFVVSWPFSMSRFAQHYHARSCVMTGKPKCAKALYSRSRIIDLFDRP